MSTLPSDLTDYRHEIVRDLAWLIDSPELIALPDHLSADWLFQSAEPREKLLHFDQDPEVLIAKLRQQACYRLGYYFEDLVRIYLTYFLQPIDLKSNIQVRKDKTTVGEYDFLIRLASGEKIHLETAVKFYLYTGKGVEADLSAFMGPNRTDRLERKWQRLMNHQLALSQTPSGIHQAEELNLLPDRRSLLLKGYLFYPYAQWQDFPLIKPLNPHHARGWWLRVCECDALAEQGFRYRILMKPQWLAASKAKFHCSISHFELQEAMKGLSNPILVAELVKDKQNGFWREHSRGFIVPDSWGDADFRIQG